jgi:hypothetical protein
MLGALPRLDPARFAQPSLERFLYFHQRPGDSSLRSKLFADGEDLVPSADAREWLEQAKRRLYFEGVDPDAVTPGVPRVQCHRLLPYRYAHEFISLLEGTCHVGDILRRLLHGISRSDGITNAALSGSLCLRVSHSETQRLTVLKQFPLRDFEIAVEHVGGTWLVETVPAALLIRHFQTGARLRVTLDLFELLLRFNEGLERSSLELQPLLEDLEPFKSAVMLSNTTDLVIVENDTKYHRLTQRDGKVVRDPMEVRA